MKNDEHIKYDCFADLLMNPDRFFNPAHLLIRAAHQHEHRIALIYKNEKIMYGSLYQRALFWQKLLEQKGVKPGDRVIIFCQNAPAFYIGYCAAWQIGAVVVPLNTFLKKSEIALIVQEATPAAVFVDEEQKDLFSESGGEILLITDRMMSEQEYRSYPEFPFEMKDTGYDPDATSVLVYTSGTTGTPKGVMLTGRSIVTNICQSLTRLTLIDNERVAAVLPLFHVFAQIASFWMSFLVGATVILVQKIDRANLLSVFEHKPTIFFGVPALYGFLCVLKTAPLDTVRLFISGGDALPDKIRMLFALIYGRKIINGYGLSETSPVIAFDCDDVVAASNTVGFPLIDIQCEIRDETGRVCEANEIGVLFVKSDSVMKGYYEAAEATAAVLENGWFCTGDYAYWARSGKLVVTGRQKDLIVNKGLKIYPQEVENILLSHPLVIRAAVIGIHDDESGQVPIAWVQVRSVEPELEKELKNMCMQQLATYKVPRKIFCVIQDLPLTATGKVNKKALVQTMK
jgi:long-chain acyl-CoA synthetase